MQVAITFMQIQAAGPGARRAAGPSLGIAAVAAIDSVTANYRVRPEADFGY